MRSLVRFMAAALAVGTCLAASGCSPVDDERSGVAITNDDVFIRDLSSAIQGGEQVPFRDLTDFEWQTVSVFSEGATPAEVEDEVGKAVINERFMYPGGFFVFCADGDIVAALAYPYPNLVYYEQNTFSSDLVVSAQGDLQDPGGTDIVSACV